MHSNILTVVPATLLLLGALMQGLFARILSSRAKGWMAFAFSLASAVGVLMMWPYVLRGGSLDLPLLVWDGPASLTFHVDGLSFVFALMGSLIGAAVLLYSVDYMAHDRSSTRFYIIMQVFIAGLLTFVSAADMLLMYAGWEVIGLCSFMLVGFWYTQPEAAAGARKVLVMTHIAGYGLLAAILVLFARTGSTLWTDPRVAQAFSGGLFALMLVAALAKSVQFPLHTWIASAMSAPTPVSALLHAACYVKAGVYLVARMHSFGAWPVAWQSSVVWIGTVTMLVGVLFAMIQHDAKRLLAFHTVSQIGYMMVGLGIGTPLGIAAGLLHCFNHGLFKGGLFLGAGAVQHATGTRDMDELGGLARRMPKTTGLWLVSAAAIAGVPLFNGFVSKWLLYVAAMKAGYTVPALVAWVVSALTMFSFMKASSAMFFGEDGPASDKAHESPALMIAGSGILAAGCVLLGVAPQLGMDYVIAPALSALGMKSDLAVGWLGLSTSVGSWYSSAGLLLAVLSMAVGLAAYWIVARRRGATFAPAVVIGGPALAAGGPAVTGLQPLAFVAEQASSSPFTGGAPLPRDARVKASDFSATVRTGIAPFYKYFDVDRYYLAVWRRLLRVADGIARVGEVLERNAVVSLTAVAAVIGLAAAFVPGVVRTADTAQAATQWPILGAASLAALSLLLAASAVPTVRRQTLLAAVSALLAIIALLVTDEVVRLIALEGAAVVALATLVLTRVERGVWIAYLAALLLSAAAIFTGTFMLETGPANVVYALLLAGFAVKLALVPAYLWLPKMAENTPAPLVGVIVAVVDVSAFAEIIGLRQTAPWLFSPSWPWLALAALTAVGGATLALAQRDLKRFLAFSSIADAGYILMGVIAGGPIGIAGATIGTAAHALAKGLLFTSVTAAEADGPVDLSVRGLARRHPVAAAGFIAGSLAALGVPPTAGYAGHWRLYSSALSLSPWLLALLVAATALSVLAYARFMALTWWGRPEGDSHSAEQGEAASIWSSDAAPLIVSIVVMTVCVVAAGLWPRVL